MPLEYFLPVIVLGSFIVSALLTVFARALARRFTVIDEPTGGRKIHEKPTALWGGIGTGLTITIVLVTALSFIRADDIRPAQITGFIIAILILLVGGMLDDRFDLRPCVQFLSPLFASVAILVSGSGIIQVTDPFGPGAISLIWTQLQIGALTVSLPADLLTIAWLLTVTYAMKFLDGLDGLVAGLTVIGGFLIAGLAGSEAYFQPVIAMLALGVAAAHLGFLPFNRSGSIFLGEAGSTIAGFSLGVLAVISGAKVAIAATALGVPLVDIALVVIGRIVRGKSPFKGDNTHLHFRLLQAGLSRRGAVRLIWGIALVFGLAALTMQTRGKIFLFAGLVAVILTISYIAYTRSRDRRAASEQ
jgi:UDP-GlcNAc:undecaprenyl-phosphate GlcNAc-1-phosphate transferase